ncbi:MAG: nucleotidyltransferase substrate binding protein [Sphaerochaetaceae bacterium]|nr:nucleotidyltransferase substrate binding protein [Sphaerochaetaceae bacterium]
MEQDVRWIQRFQNYGKALSQLEEFLALDSLNKFELQGLIQCFEYTFELSWKTLKDYLISEGIEVPTPRKAIQEGFKSGVIEDGHTWIEALESRNLMAHTYNEEYVTKAETLIRNEFYPVLRALLDVLSKEL